MICPKRGKESVKDALYCEWCGTKFENRIDKKHKSCICPKCGKESVKDAIYCEWCGTSLYSDDKNEDTIILYNSRKKYLWFLIASVCCVALGFWVVGQSRQELAEYHITGSGRFLTGQPDGLLFVGWICIVFFGGTVLFLLCNYKNYAKKPWIILDSDGFYSCSRNSGFKGKIGWIEMIDFKTIMENNDRFLIIEFATKYERYESTRTYSLTEGSLKDQEEKSVRLFIDMLEISDGKLIDLMQKYQNKYGHE